MFAHFTSYNNIWTSRTHKVRTLAHSHKSRGVMRHVSRAISVPFPLEKFIVHLSLSRVKLELWEGEGWGQLSSRDVLLYWRSVRSVRFGWEYKILESLYKFEKKNNDDKSVVIDVLINFRFNKIKKNQVLHLLREYQHPT